MKYQKPYERVGVYYRVCEYLTVSGFVYVGEWDWTAYTWENVK